MKKTPLLEVHWEDACSSSAWVTKDEMSHWHDDKMICITVGYLGKQDKHGITIYNTTNQRTKVAGTWFIPKGMIRKIVVLKK